METVEKIDSDVEALHSELDRHDGKRSFHCNTRCRYILGIAGLFLLMFLFGALMRPAPTMVKTTLVPAVLDLQAPRVIQPELGNRLTALYTASKQGGALIPTEASTTTVPQILSWTPNAVGKHHGDGSIVALTGAYELPEGWFGIIRLTANGEEIGSTLVDSRSTQTPAQGTFSILPTSFTGEKNIRLTLDAVKGCRLTCAATDQLCLATNVNHCTPLSDNQSFLAYTSAIAENLPPAGTCVTKTFVAGPKYAPQIPEDYTMCTRGPLGSWNGNVIAEASQWLQTTALDRVSKEQRDAFVKTGGVQMIQQNFTTPGEAGNLEWSFREEKGNAATAQMCSVALTLKVDCKEGTPRRTSMMDTVIEGGKTALTFAYRGLLALTMPKTAYAQAGQCYFQLSLNVLDGWGNLVVNSYAEHSPACMSDESQCIDTVNSWATMASNAGFLPAMEWYNYFPDSGCGGGGGGGGPSPVPPPPPGPGPVPPPPPPSGPSSMCGIHCMGNAGVATCISDAMVVNPFPDSNGYCDICGGLIETCGGGGYNDCGVPSAGWEWASPLVPDDSFACGVPPGPVPPPPPPPSGGTGPRLSVQDYADGILRDYSFTHTQNFGIQQFPQWGNKILMYFNVANPGTVDSTYNVTTSGLGFSVLQGASSPPGTCTGTAMRNIGNAIGCVIMFDPDLTGGDLNRTGYAYFTNTTPGAQGENPIVVTFNHTSAIPPCPATTIGWGISCSAPIASHANGYSEVLTNTNPSANGVATAMCTNGKWQKSSASCSGCGMNTTLTGNSFLMPIETPGTCGGVTDGTCFPDYDFESGPTEFCGFGSGTCSYRPELSIVTTCVTGLSITANTVPDLTLPATAFTQNYSLIGGDASDTLCQLLDNSGNVLAGWISCDGTYSFNTPSAPGVYGYRIQANKTSTSENVTSNMFTVTVHPVAPCTPPWGGSVADGSSVTAYQNASVVSPASCVSETRTCSGSTLSGSYVNQSCSVTPAPCPLIADVWGSGCSATQSAQASGYSGTLSNTAPGYSGTETASCTNGSWSFSGESCTAAPCANGANNPPTCNTCTAPDVYNGSSCVAPMSITANLVSAITLPTTAFTQNYSLSNGNVGNTNCRLLDNAANPLTGYTPCDGDIAWATPAAMGGYGYYIQAVKSSTGETRTSNMFTVTVNGSSCTPLSISNCDLSGVSSGNSSGSCGVGYSGSCGYLCSNGVWGVTSNTCTPAPCANGANNPPTCNTCTLPNVYNGTSCVAPISVTANAIPSITLPTTSFTQNYILSGGTVANTGCQLLDNLGNSLSGAYTPCDGDITWNTPSAPGSYGYFIRANKPSTGETRTSNMFTVVVAAAPPSTGVWEVKSCIANGLYGAITPTEAGYCNEQFPVTISGPVTDFIGTLPGCLSPLPSSCTAGQGVNWSCWSSGFAGVDVEYLCSAVTPPANIVNPGVINFGAVAVTTSVSRNVPLENTGGLPATVSLSLPSTPEGTWSVDLASQGTFVIAPYDTHIVVLTFTAGAVGGIPFSGNLGVVGANSVIIPVSGTVSIAAPTTLGVDLFGVGAMSDLDTINIGNIAASTGNAEYDFVITKSGPLNMPYQVSIQGGTAAGYSFAPAPINGGCSGTISAANPSDVCRVTFNPDASIPGLRPATILFDNQTAGPIGGADPLRVNFTANVQLGPSAGVFPDTGVVDVGVSGPVAGVFDIDFGSVDVYTTKTRSIAIANTGDTSLDITSYDALIPPAFTSSPSGFVAVLPGGNHPIAIDFRPLTAGAQIPSIITVQTNDTVNFPGGVVTIRVSGTGNPVPNLTVKPDLQLPLSWAAPGGNIGFPDQDVYIGPSDPKIVTITNNGSLSSTVTLTVDDPAFTITPVIDNIIPAGQSRDFEVRFDPSPAGSYPDSHGGTITITATGLIGSTQVFVNGNGIIETPGITPLAISFGPVVVTKEKDIVVTITNNDALGRGFGTVDLSIPDLDFICISPSPCQITLPMNGTSQITLRFKPIVTGDQATDLFFTSTTNPSINGFRIPITGKGVRPLIKYEEN